MSLDVSVNELAEAEFFDAVEYYLRVSPEIASAFITAVAQAIEFVVTYPEGSPVIGSAVRAKQVQRFPYALLYSIRPDRIRILAVMNQRRRPFYWRGRA